MRSSPVSAWQELSALYEQADELDGAALDAWLVSPKIAEHAQLPALRRMLAARAHLRDSDFLNAPPHLERAAAAGVETQALRVGTPIGPYRLLSPLGAGGMAEVWLAERSDGAFQRRVAIKLMFRQVGGAARDSVAQRFARERDILASLDHPNIAALHDAGVTPAGQPWLALEYVEGRPLGNWCDHARLGVAGRVRLFRQVLLAVQHAHAKLVMHRDLKPANILVAEGGEVHLLDFGIAKLLEPGEGAQADTELTRAAGRLLTPLYASPEQLRGEALTIACDVYALGVVLYELLSGERPYEVKATSALRLEQAILEADPRAPSRRALREEAAEQRGLSAKALRKALAGDLDAIVLHALAKQPARRYASAEAMLADIDRWLDGEPVKAHAPSALYRWGKFVRRNRLGVGLGSSAVLALAGVATVAVIQGQQAQRESARAVAARDFMIDMFRRADPEKARGTSITAGELLDSGRKDVSQRLMHQPELQVDLLKAIATIQFHMNEYVNADSTYDEAARIHELLGEHRLATTVRVEHAWNAYQSGNYPRAKHLIAMAHHNSSRERLDGETGARLAYVEGWVESRTGNPERAEALFRQSQVLATAAYGPNDVNVLDALLGRSQVAADRRNFAEAMRLQDEVALRMNGNGAVEARDAAGFAYERVTMHYRAGRFRSAFELASAAATACIAAEGGNFQTCRLIVLTKALAALRLGWAERVRADLPTVAATAQDRLSPQRSAHALQLLCRLQAAIDKRPVAPTIERQLRAIAASTGPAALDAEARVVALLSLGEADLRAGRWEGATTEISAALGSEAEPTPASSVRAWGKTLMGVALLQAGRTGEALDWFRRADAEHRAVFGSEHTLALTFSLNQAVALDRLGRRAEALLLVRRAEPALRAALGADAPVYLSVLELERRLSLAPAESSTSAPSGGSALVAKVPPLPFFI